MILPYKLARKNILAACLSTALNLASGEMRVHSSSVSSRWGQFHSLPIRYFINSTSQYIALYIECAITSIYCSKLLSSIERKVNISLTVGVSLHCIVSPVLLTFSCLICLPFFSAPILQPCCILYRKSSYHFSFPFN